MLVVMDVGNTNTVIGVYEGDQLLSHWRIRTEREATIDEFGILLRNLFQADGLSLTPGTELIISSVVPPMLVTLEGFAYRYLKVRPLWVGPAAPPARRVQRGYVRQPARGDLAEDGQ